MPLDDLGSRLLLAGFSVRGPVDQPMAERLLADLALNMEVSPVHSPTIYCYPSGGKGGTGFTLIQPITESFLAVDAWPDHGGAYLVLASCKWFDVDVVERVLNLLGLTVVGRTYTGLTLDHAQN